MGLRVVLVEPEFELNVGSAARAMKNFGVKRLFLVRPKCKLGLEAKKFAKHSEEVLLNAKTVKTLEAALAGVDVAVGTTGIAVRYSRELKNVMAVREAVRKLSPSEETAVIFGSESRGLRREELARCDLVLHIPSSPEHPVLNLSHAVAVVLYEFFSVGFSGVEAASLPRTVKPASRKERLHLEKMFSELVHAMPLIKNPRKVSNAFRNVVERSRVSRDEAAALLAPIGPMRRMAKKTGEFVKTLATFPKRKGIKVDSDKDYAEEMDSR